MFKVQLLAFVSLCFPLSVLAAEDVKSALSSNSLSSSIWQMALGLLLVLGLIFLLAWLMRRVGGVQGARQHIKILSAVNVGTRERAVLVEVGGEQLLLGVAAGNVTLLHKLESPVSSPVSVSAGDFASKLQSATSALTKRARSSDE